MSHFIYRSHRGCLNSLNTDSSRWAELWPSLDDKRWLKRSTKWRPWLTNSALIGSRWILWHIIKHPAQFTAIFILLRNLISKLQRPLRFAFHCIIEASRRQVNFWRSSNDTRKQFDRCHWRIIKVAAQWEFHVPYDAKSFSFFGDLQRFKHDTSVVVVAKV